jgi:multisubunit Na+/H+ antiporter MnhG subunit
LLLEMCCAVVVVAVVVEEGDGAEAVVVDVVAVLPRPVGAHLASAAASLSLRRGLNSTSDMPTSTHFRLYSCESGNKPR